MPHSTAGQRAGDQHAAQHGRAESSNWVQHIRRPYPGHIRGSSDVSGHNLFPLTTAMVDMVSALIKCRMQSRLVD